MSRQRTAWIAGLLGAFLILAGLCLSIVPVKAQSGRAVAVICACDPPGRYHKPGFNCQAYCTGGSSGGGSRGMTFSPAEQAMMGLLQNLVQNIFTSMLTANDRAVREKSYARERELDRLREQERQRQEAERQRRLEMQRAWERARDETYQQMKGAKPGTLTMKDTGTGFFGTGGGGGRQLEFKTVGVSASGRLVEGSWAQLHCSSALSRISASAAARGDAKEAEYLQEQSSRAMGGKPVNVECPTPPRLPELGSTRPTSEQRVLYSLLLESTNREMGRLFAVEDRIREFEARREETQQQVQEHKQEVERTEQLPVNPDEPEAAAEKQSLLEEALAALQEAEAADAQASELLEKALSERKEIEAIVKRNQDCFEKAQQDPDQAEALKQSCVPQS